MGAQRCTVVRLQTSTTDDVVSVPFCSTDAYSTAPKVNTRRVERKWKNDHAPNLIRPYHSTETEVDQSEDITLTTIYAEVYERSLVAITHKFVD
jgi:hypothetical protein